jgi:hypothetical protein
MTSSLAVCGLLDTSGNVQDPVIAEKARSLTISWLRWGYSGNIIEGKSVNEILDRAQEAAYEYCFLQSYGHIVTEQWSPKHDESRELFRVLSDWILTMDFLVTGHVVKAGGNYALLNRAMVVNLAHYQRLGRPRFDGRIPTRSEPSTGTLAPETTVLAPSEFSGASWISASLTHGLSVYNFPPVMTDLMLDLGSDLTQRPEFLDGLRQASSDSQRGVFVWNFEPYDDILEPPDDFSGPVSILYSVAAGLKSNMILRTHGFGPETEIVFFDYSSAGLAFRKLLLEEWDGQEYPAFLRKIFQRMPPPATHYYLWPGVTPHNVDWRDMDRLWEQEVARWGGEERIKDHWALYRKLKHSFVSCNILREQHKILDRMTDDPKSVAWWSNAFSTVYSGWHYTPEQKMSFYEDWVRGVALKAPKLLLYGSDHSNSSVNGYRAADYCEQYHRQGGDPLLERSFYRRKIRF